MGGLLREQATWIAVAAVLGAVSTWLIVRKSAGREVSTVGRHRADTPEPPLGSAEPAAVGAHMKTMPEPAQG